MVQILKKQLKNTNPDNDNEQYTKYKQQLVKYNKLLSTALCRNPDLTTHDTEWVEWEDER